MLTPLPDTPENFLIIGPYLTADKKKNDEERRRRGKRSLREREEEEIKCSGQTSLLMSSEH
jgi:hypothetical protein